MKDDLDRWVDLEGPPPEDVRELLDAACDADMEARLERLNRRVLSAVAEDRLRRARRRALARTVGGLLVAAGVAGAVVLAFQSRAVWDLPGVSRMLPDAARPVALPRTAPRPAALAPADAGPEDAGPRTLP